MNFLIAIVARAAARKNDEDTVFNSGRVCWKANQPVSSLPVQEKTRSRLHLFFPGWLSGLLFFLFWLIADNGLQGTDGKNRAFFAADNQGNRADDHCTIPLLAVSHAGRIQRIFVITIVGGAKTIRNDRR